MSQRSAHLSSLVQVFLLIVKEITSFIAILLLLTQRRLFSHPFSRLLEKLHFECHFGTFVIFSSFGFGLLLFAHMKTKSKEAS